MNEEYEGVVKLYIKNDGNISFFNMNINVGGISKTTSININAHNFIMKSNEYEEENIFVGLFLLKNPTNEEYLLFLNSSFNKIDNENFNIKPNICELKGFV